MDRIVQLPFIPFIHSAEDVLFAGFVFARVFGLFLISPLLSNPHISGTVRSLLSVFVATLLILTNYGSYRGEAPRYELPIFNLNHEWTIVLVAIAFLKEVAIGFLIGFCFSLIFEALLFAGQIASFLIGFSLAELFDPISGVTQALLSQIFVLVGFLLMLSSDLHHSFLRTLSDSFEVLPIGNYHLNHETLQTVSSGTARLWEYAMQLTAIPFVILFLVTVGLGFMAKIMPEMNIFMLGFPLKIFIGYYALIVAVGFFPLILQEAFVEFDNLARLIIGQIARGDV